MWYWLLGAWTKFITDSSQQLNRRVFGCHSNQWKALFVQEKKKEKKNIPPKTWLFSPEGWIPDRNCLSESDKRMKERQSPHVLCEPLTLQALSEGLTSFLGFTLRPYGRRRNWSRRAIELYDQKNYIFDKKSHAKAYFLISIFYYFSSVFFF